MQLSVFGRSALLVGLGAAAAGVGFIAGHTSETHDAILRDDQLGQVTEHLRRIEELLQSQANGQMSTPAAVTPTPEPRREKEDDRRIQDELLRLLRSVRAESRTGDSMNTGKAEVTRNGDALAKILEQTKNDNDGVFKRHFCWSPRDVYETYGAPDQAAKDNNGIYWAYRLGEARPGEWKWLVFRIAEGVVYHAHTIEARYPQ